MPAIDTTDALLEVIEKSELLTATQLAEFLDRKRAENTLPQDPYKLAQHFVFGGLLTKYQAEQLLGGRYRNFVLGGKYKLLEQLGRGGMASVFLCEHQVMKRLVAVKILPKAHADDRELLGRFHREARALSQLSHPNIVAAFDVDHANNVHFLVMEYVDGGDLDFIVQKSGPMVFERSAHYIRQAARGLQHAHECGLVHRDMKPGNLLVDRSGTVKLLDLGLARIFHESTDDLTTGRDARMLLGTVDYLAPEQALNSHEVDIRADIYGLGATFYFLLAGRGLFEGGTVAQKLAWHLRRPPVSIAEVRPDAPPGLVQVIETMLAKKPEDRYQSPEEVVEALIPWTMSPIPPPRSSELPQLSLAARGSGQQPSAHRITSPSVRTLIAPRSQVSASPPSTSTDLTPPRRVLEEISLGPIEPPSPAPSTPVPSMTVEPNPPPTKPPLRFLRPSGVACGLLLLGAAAWWASGRIWPGDPSAGRSPGEGLRVSSLNAESGPRTPGVTTFLAPGHTADATFSIVSGEAPPSSYATLGEAIRAAQPGDRILVQGHLLTETVEISDVEGTPSDLTIQADDSGPSFVPIRWRAPRDLAQGRALLEVSGLEGFRLKGFELDGEGRLPELIRLAGRASGSTLEDLEIRGATRAGLVVQGWSGETSRPATLRNVRFATGREVDAAIVFDADRDRPTASSSAIRVDSCRFVGPFRSAILIAGSVEGLEVVNCRFQGATDALRYRKSQAREPLSARLANNVFSDLRRGLFFETTPPAASSDLVLANNLFSNVGRLATLDKVSVRPSAIPGRWIWAEGPGKDRAVPPGVRYFRKVFDLETVPDRARLDISCDETFAVWLNGSEVGKDPSAHYTQRVFAFEIADRLRPGPNVLSVIATNRPDPIDADLDTTAGLLVQLTARSNGSEVALARTDETWKWAAHAPEGWSGAEFDDRTWTSARLIGDAGPPWPWTYAVWDSTVLPQLRPPLEPIRVEAWGNVRDQVSWEGYPTLGAERVVFRAGALPKDPVDDSSFLRLPRTHPLRNSGQGGSAIGVFREE